MVIALWGVGDILEVEVNFFGKVFCVVHWTNNPISDSLSSLSLVPNLSQFLKHRNRRL